MAPLVTGGGWYCDVTLGGAWVVLVRDSHLETNAGRVELPHVNGDPELPRQNLLYIRMDASGSKFAGIGHQDDRCWEWKAGAWHDRGLGCGVNAVIYDRLGTLHISDCSVGSQGWRYVERAGNLVTGDNSIRDLDRRIWEYTDLDTLTIGQGGDGPHGADPIIALLDGKRYLLVEGRCKFIRAYQQGSLVALAWVQEDRAEARRWWLSLDEIRARPVIGEGLPPKPAPIPLDQIEPLEGEWLVAWYEQKGNVPPELLPPGNAQVAVRGHTGVVPRPTIVTPDTVGTVSGQIIGFRVGSEGRTHHDPLGEMEEEARERAVHGYRVVWYWDQDRRPPRWPILPPGSLIELKMFCGVDEPLDRFEADADTIIAEAVARYRYVVLACQTHTTNRSLLREPSRAIPIVVRLAKKHRHGDEGTIGFTIFNNTGRDDHDPTSPTFGEGGLTANPQLLPHWERVFSGVTGLPKFLREGEPVPPSTVTVDIIDYDRKTSRRDPRGMLVRFDAHSDRPIVKVECRFEYDEPPIVLTFPVTRGSDGRYVRGLAFKPVRTGDFHFTLTASDDAGASGSARSDTPVTVTEDPVDGGSPGGNEEPDVNEPLLRRLTEESWARHNGQNRGVMLNEIAFNYNAAEGPNTVGLSRKEAGEHVKQPHTGIPIAHDIIQVRPAAGQVFSTMYDVFTDHGPALGVADPHGNPERTFVTAVQP